MGIGQGCAKVGNVVFSKAQPETMKRISDQLNGTFTHIASEDFSIRTLLRQLLEIRASRMVEESPRKVPVEHYQWPLLLAFLFFCLETAMGTRKPAQT